MRWVCSVAVLGLCLAGCKGKGETAAPADTAAPAYDPACEEVYTWTTVGAPFVYTWCTPCHAVGLAEEDRQGAPLGVDFDTYDDVVQWISRIEDRALSTDPDAWMPPAGGPSEEELAVVAAWIACGVH